MPERHNAFRDGKVHVLAEQCRTCIFRPGNPMRLEPGRVKEMVASALRDDSAIICHSTLYRGEPVRHAVCRGFFDSYTTLPLRLALVMRRLEEVPAAVYDTPAGPSAPAPRGVG